MRHRIFIGLIAVAISGCAVNGYEKFYAPSPGSKAAMTDPLLVHSSEEPKIYSFSADPQADFRRVAEEGYLQIGSSSFYGPANIMTQDQLVRQAKKVGAALVLVHSQHKDTLSGVIPYTVPNPSQVSTVSTTGTVNGYGTNGYTTANYNAQSTVVSPGGTTTYSIPYSVDRNDVTADYFVLQDKTKIRLGVISGPLPDELRKKLQRNTGIIAQVIIRGTPAFNANILRDDVILRIGGDDVIDPISFTDQLTKFEGQRVTLEVLRGNEPKTFSVTLGHH